MLLLILKAGANRYAIDVARIIELVPRVDLRTIPHAPSFLAGLLGYRGSVIPVIDLGLLLESEPVPRLPQYADYCGKRLTRRSESRGDCSRGVE